MCVTDVDNVFLNIMECTNAHAERIYNSLLRNVMNSRQGLLKFKSSNVATDI